MYCSKRHNVHVHVQQSVSFRKFYILEEKIKWFWKKNIEYHPFSCDLNHEITIIIIILEKKTCNIQGNFWTSIKGWGNIHVTRGGGNLRVILTLRTERDMALEERSWDNSVLRCSLWTWDSFFMSLNLSHIRNWVDI